MDKNTLIRRLSAVILSVLLLMSVSVVNVSADDTSLTEDDTYVLNRAGNGESLYLYQSPSMVGYDLNNTHGYPGVSIQVFIFTMYNTVTNEHFPTYCSDINITAVSGTNYRRLNLEDSPFSGSAAGRVRAILQKGFYIIPIDGESADSHAARVAAKVSEIASAAGLESLTTGEAIAATQTALWQVIHGSILTFPTFCKSVFKPTNTKYANLCSYNELRYKNKEDINGTIRLVYDYLLSLEPVEATNTSVSPSSFIDLQDPVLSQNEDGTFDISVTTTVDVNMVSGDWLTLKAQINDSYFTTTEISNGTQTVTLTLTDVPAELALEDVTLTLSGYQTAEGFFFFDAVGGRTSSQAMVGYNNSRLPVFAEVTAEDKRIINIYKSTNSGGNNIPLSNITFDIYPVATMDEYNSSGFILPDATDYSYPSIPEYSVTTDENGYASFNFTYHGLSDGVYLVVERDNPSIVSPIKPFYLFVPLTSADGTELIYDITIKPKNEVNGDVQIDKDVGNIGNDEDSFDMYEKHNWIITTTIPSDISAGESFLISDTLDNRLDYLGNVQVKLEKNDGSSTVELIAGTDYILNETDVDSLSNEKPSDSFSVELTRIGMSKIANSINKNKYSDYILRVYFDAQINSNAEIASEIPNQAEIQYTNAVGIDFRETSDIPKVYTGAVNMLKLDAADNSPLSGAVFEIYRNATAEEIDAEDSRLSEISGVANKVIKVSFYNNEEMSGEKVTSVTSDIEGKLAVYGLAYGRYYIVETAAPDGYNILSKAIEFSIDETSHLEGNEIQILNKTGSLLPETGGIGTTVYLVIGSLLMLSSGILLYKKKKNSFV